METRQKDRKKRKEQKKKERKAESEDPEALRRNTSGSSCEADHVPDDEEKSKTITRATTHRIPSQAVRRAPRFAGCPAPTPPLRSRSRGLQLIIAREWRRSKHQKFSR